MKKSILMGVLMVLVAIGASGVTYCIMSKNDRDIIQNNEKSGNTECEEKVECPKEKIVLKGTIESGNKITQEYEVILNDKIVPIKIEFTKKNEEVMEETTRNIEVIEGTLNNINMFYDWSYISTKDENNYFIPSIIDNDFNTNNFKIIKGKDNKEYLLVFSKVNDYYVPISDFLVIFNDEMELLTNPLDNPKDTCSYDDENSILINTGNGGISPDENVWYENTFGYKTAHRFLTKVEDDKIYHLYQRVNTQKHEEGNYGVIEEREYTINNNKLEYKIINKYKATDVFGSMC